MSIRVKVELMSAVRCPREERNFELELPSGATVRMMLTMIGFKEDEVEHLRVFVNNKWAHLDKALKDDDEVWVGVVVGGGVDWGFTTRKPLERCQWPLKSSWDLKRKAGALT